MTNELKEKIADKLLRIEQEVAQIRMWVEAGTNKDPVFLAEVQAMKSVNATHDPGADDEVPYVATPAEIPTDAELYKALSDPKAAEKAELEKRFGLEKEGEALPITSDYNPNMQNELLLPTDTRYFPLCKWLIQNEKTIQQVHDFLNERQLRVDEKEHDHLKNIIWFRSELLKGKEGSFDLKSILSQNDTTEQEKPVWEALAKTMK